MLIPSNLEETRRAVSAHRLKKAFRHDLELDKVDAAYIVRIIPAMHWLETAS
jgi:hypothetical protein